MKSHPAIARGVDFYHNLHLKFKEKHKKLYLRKDSSNLMFGSRKKSGS